MSKWVSVCVMSRLDVLVEVEDEDEDWQQTAQEIALDERGFGGVNDITECREVTGHELDSAKRHADEVVSLED